MKCRCGQKAGRLPAAGRERDALAGGGPGEWLRSGNASKLNSRPSHTCKAPMRSPACLPAHVPSPTRPLAARPPTHIPTLADVPAAAAVRAVCDGRRMGCQHASSGPVQVAGRGALFALWLSAVCPTCEAKLGTSSSWQTVCSVRATCWASFSEACLCCACHPPPTAGGRLSARQAAAPAVGSLHCAGPSGGVPPPGAMHQPERRRLERGRR